MSQAGPSVIQADIKEILDFQSLIYFQSFNFSDDIKLIKNWLLRCKINFDSIHIDSTIYNRQLITNHAMINIFITL